MSRELIRNTGIYVFVGFAVQGLVFILWLALGRWLAPAEVGVYALAMFVVELLSAVSLLGLDAALLRFQATIEDARTVLSSGVGLFLGATAITAVMFLVLIGPLSGAIPGLGPLLHAHRFLVLALIAANAMMNLALAYHTAVKDALSYGTLQGVKVVLFCLLAIVLVRIGAGIVGVLQAALLSACVAIVYFIRRARRHVAWPALSAPLAQHMAAYGLPLMAYAVLGIVASYFGRLLLDRYTDPTALGTYSFFLALTLQVNGMWSSINRAWTPEIFSRLKANADPQNRVRVMAFASSFVYLILLVIVGLSGDMLWFKWVFREPYLSQTRLFLVLLLGPLFVGIYTAMYPLFYFENRTGRILTISLLLMVTNLGLTELLVHAWHQVGAALAFVTVTAATPLVYAAAFRNVVKVPGALVSLTWVLAMVLAAGVFAQTRLATVLPFYAALVVAAGACYRMGRLDREVLRLAAARVFSRMQVRSSVSE